MSDHIPAKPINKSLLEKIASVMGNNASIDESKKKINESSHGHPHSIWNQRQGEHTAHVSVVNDKYAYDVYDKHGKSIHSGAESSLESAKKSVFDKFNALKEDIDLDEAKKDPWKTHLDNEDNNAHSDNVIHYAKHVGTPEDVTKAKAIKAKHLKDGHMTPTNMSQRNELSDKLWPKFREKFGPKNESMDGEKSNPLTLGALRKITEEYDPKNPKINLHNKETGEYLASTNWSPTIKHAVEAYEKKYPHMAGKVGALKAKK